MVVDVLRLTRWEWFKLRKRWMPWILLGIIVVIAQLALWSAYLTYRNTDIGEELKITTFGGPTAADIWECREIEHPRDVCEDQERGERLYRKFERPRFILPISLANSLGFAQLFGVIFAPILASIPISQSTPKGPLLVDSGAGRIRKRRRWVFGIAGPVPPQIGGGSTGHDDSRSYHA